MKLQNIILALCVAVAFTACSKDDNTDNPYANAPAKLTVKVTTKGATTKADPNELEGEANINTLTALVFNPTTGNKVGEMRVTPNVSHTYTMQGIPAMELGTARLMLVANAPATIAQVTTYAELESLLANLDDQVQDDLTMSTPLYTVTNLVEGLNNVGELILTRVPARLQIGRVVTNFTRPALLGRHVQILEVSFENAKSQSRYCSIADWGEVQVKDHFVTTPTFAPTNVAVNNTDPALNIYHTYVMENLGIDSKPTAVIVKARLQESHPYYSETRSFRAVVNPNGLERKTADHNYVKRNYVYSLGITFGNDSFNGEIRDPDPDPDPDPVDSMIDVKVTVVAWGDVNQSVIIGDDDNEIPAE